MNRTQAISAMKEIKLTMIELGESRIMDASKRLKELFSFLEEKLELKDDLLKMDHGIPVCICEDGRGWSTCGGECPDHPRSTCASAGDASHAHVQSQGRGVLDALRRWPTFASVFHAMTV
ncbi:MAG: hypothetical protein HC814_03800 [Rhodobacteraceae bacterium]|nr:hypothetical protein [Paracoccaceae bacterium]